MISLLKQVCSSRWEISSHPWKTIFTAVQTDEHSYFLKIATGLHQFLVSLKQEINRKVHRSGIWFSYSVPLVLWSTYIYTSVSNSQSDTSIWKSLHQTPCFNARHLCHISVIDTQKFIPGLQISTFLRTSTYKKKFFNLLQNWKKKISSK